MKKLRITVEGKTYEVTVEVLDESGPASHSAAVSAAGASVSAPVSSSPKPAAQQVNAGDVQSPLAGKVISVDVKPGQEVKEGETLLILEAMKMNTLVTAPAAGKVKAVHAAAGDAVEEGQVLVSFE